jgi:hypothetical protein
MRRQGPEVTANTVAPETAGSVGTQTMARPPAGCTDPDRWLDAYLIAEAHRAERGVCQCGRPLPCIAAQRADAIMAETMRAVHAAEAEAEAQRAISRAVTQELPVIRVVRDMEDDGAPVGARFRRPRQRNREPDETSPPAPVPSAPAFPLPSAAPAPTGARFYRERKSPRHRAD